MKYLKDEVYRQESYYYYVGLVWQENQDNLVAMYDGTVISSAHSITNTLGKGHNFVTMTSSYGLSTASGIETNPFVCQHN